MKDNAWEDDEKAMIEKVRASMLEGLAARKLPSDGMKDLRLAWQQRDGKAISFTYIATLKDGRELRFSIDRQGNQKTTEIGENEV
jgi:hypothetical protein